MLRVMIRGCARSIDALPGANGVCPLEMEYLSYSRLTLYETCGLRFYYEYILRLPPEDETPTYHASFGKLLHALYEEHAESAGRLVYDDLRALYDRDFPGIVPEFPERAVAVAFYREGLRALSRFSHYRVEDVVASEREFCVEIDAHTPPVRGFIDRLIHTQEHGYIVADLKTGKVFSARDPRKMRQLVVYSLACGELYGRYADSGYFDFAVQGRREWVDIGEDERAETRSWIGRTWRAILEERWSPRFSFGYCSAYCPFRSRCPEFQEKGAARAHVVQ